MGKKKSHIKSKGLHSRYYRCNTCCISLWRKRCTSPWREAAHCERIWLPDVDVCTLEFGPFVPNTALMTENQDEFKPLLHTFFPPSCIVGIVRTALTVLQLFPVKIWLRGADVTERELPLASPQPSSPERFICIQGMIKESLLHRAAGKLQKKHSTTLPFVFLSWKPVLWVCWVPFSWWDCDVEIAYPIQMGQQELLLIQIA